MNGLFDAEYFDFESKIVAGVFRIYVGKPAVVEAEKLYPVIFALDGNASFASLTATQRMLTQGGEVPPSFVIGIGYPGNTLAESMANRNRDYAPTPPGENEARMLGGLAPAGGPAFLKFIQQELKPLLAEGYAIDVENCTVQGISLGGLFAAWTLLTQPATFKRYILGSPALWWRDQQVWQWENTFAENHDDLTATVFVSAGELEVKELVREDAIAIAQKNPQIRAYVEDMINWSDSHGWPEIAKLTSEFSSRLRARQYPNLKIHCHHMPGENHMSAPPAISSRGLRYVHGSWSP